MTRREWWQDLDGAFLAQAIGRDHVIAAWIKKLSPAGTDAEAILRTIDANGEWRIRLTRPDGSVAQLRLNAAGTEVEVELLPAPTKSRMARAPRVFVCYAHDSDGHKKTVRAFVEFLRSNGIDARMDGWDQDRRRDWHLWATRQIKSADFVLVIASPECRMIGDGEGPADQHRGLRSELALLRELATSRPDTWSRRILPVVLPGHSIGDIPVFLQPHTADHYVVTEFTVEGAEDLLRHVTRQPPFIAPPLGPLPVMRAAEPLYGHPRGHNPGSGRYSWPDSDSIPDRAL